MTGHNQQSTVSNNGPWCLVRPEWLQHSSLSSSLNQTNEHPKVMAAGNLNASSDPGNANHIPTMNRPKGIISKLSSRNRRRRRENREHENIPIPSFSYSSQGESREVRDERKCGEDGRVQVQTRGATGKENSPSGESAPMLTSVNPPLSGMASLDHTKSTLQTPSTNNLKRKAADCPSSPINLDPTEPKFDYIDYTCSVNSDNATAPTTPTNENNSASIKIGQSVKSSSSKKRKYNLDGSDGFVSALQLISSQANPTAIPPAKRALPAKNTADDTTNYVDLKKQKHDNSTVVVKPNLGEVKSSINSILGQSLPLSLDSTSSEPASSLPSCTNYDVNVATSGNALSISSLLHTKSPAETNETAKGGILSTNSNATDKAAKPVSSETETSVPLQHTKFPAIVHVRAAHQSGPLLKSSDATNLGPTVTNLPPKHAKTTARLGSSYTNNNKSTPTPHATSIGNKQYSIKSTDSTSSTRQEPKKPTDGADSDVEIVEAPSTKHSKPKSCKSINSVSRDLNKTDSNQLELKRVKKEPAAKANGKAKPAASNKKVVIELDDCSASSSSSSDDCVIRKRRLKSTGAKKTSVKVEKKVKSKVKNEPNYSGISGTNAKENAEPKKSAKQCKPKSTRIQTSASSDNKKLCFACSSCKCNSRDATSATPQKPSVFATLSTSDARQEQALINRLQKIERNVQWMDSQKADVGRQLMKHRNVMAKKWEAQNGAKSSDRPKFLADVEEWHGVQLDSKMNANEVKRAGRWTFGEAKGKYYLGCYFVWFTPLWCLLNISDVFVVPLF
jgi:hypothetical protein